MQAELVRRGLARADTAARSAATAQLGVAEAAARREQVGLWTGGGPAAEAVLAERALRFVGEGVSVRVALSPFELARLPMLETLLESREAGFQDPETDPDGAVVVRVPGGLSGAHVRWFCKGRRSEPDDFLLAAYFCSPDGIREVAAAYVKAVAAAVARSRAANKPPATFDAALAKFLDLRPSLLQLFLQLGPELGLPQARLMALFDRHCHKVPMKRKRILLEALELVASGRSSEEATAAVARAAWFRAENCTFFGYPT